MSHDAGATGKKCNACGELKPFSDFYRQARRSARGKKYTDGAAAYRHACKTCHNEQVRKNYESQRGRYSVQRRKYHQQIGRWAQYGMTLDQYKQRREQQKGCCLICGRHEEDEYKLFVDHCHESGEVRGLLCQRCNTGLGAFEDDPERLASAINYLATARSSHVA